MNPLAALPSPGATIKGVLSELKPAHLLVGTIVFIATAYVVSRALPGAARRVGIAARPFSAMQAAWPEPFGLKPLMPMAGAPRAAHGPLSPSSLADAQSALPNLLTSGAGDLLASMTGGSGDSG